MRARSFRTRIGVRGVCKRSIALSAAQFSLRSPKPTFITHKEWCLVFVAPYFIEANNISEKGDHGSYSTREAKLVRFG
jgi:hypothetical protein